MNNLILAGGILALFPLISWLLQFYLSKSKKELHLFKKHLPTYFMDWVFVPFNLFWVYTITFNIEKFAILGLVSIIINYIGSKYYIKKHREEKRPVHLFNIEDGKSSTAGHIHSVFSMVQMFLIFTFILDSTLDIFTYINIGLLFLFLLPALFASKKIHGRVSMPDLGLFLIGVLILVLKLVLTNL